MWKITHDFISQNYITFIFCQQNNYTLDGSRVCWLLFIIKIWIEFVTPCFIIINYFVLPLLFRLWWSFVYFIFLNKSVRSEITAWQYGCIRPAIIIVSLESSRNFLQVQSFSRDVNVRVTSFTRNIAGQEWYYIHWKKISYTKKSWHFLS